MLNSIHVGCETLTYNPESGEWSNASGNITARENGTSLDVFQGGQLMGQYSFSDFVRNDDAYIPTKDGSIFNRYNGQCVNVNAGRFGPVAGGPPASPPPQGAQRYIGFQAINAEEGKDTTLILTGSNLPPVKVLVVKVDKNTTDDHKHTVTFKIGDKEYTGKFKGDQPQFKLEFDSSGKPIGIKGANEGEDVPFRALDGGAGDDISDQPAMPERSQKIQATPPVASEKTVRGQIEALLGKMDSELAKKTRKVLDEESLWNNEKVLEILKAYPTKTVATIEPAPTPAPNEVSSKKQTVREQIEALLEKMDSELAKKTREVLDDEESLWDNEKVLETLKAYPTKTGASATLAPTSAPKTPPEERTVRKQIEVLLGEMEPELAKKTREVLDDEESLWDNEKVLETLKAYPTKTVAKTESALQPTPTPREQKPLPAPVADNPFAEWKDFVTVTLTEVTVTGSSRKTQQQIKDAADRSSPQLKQIIETIKNKELPREERRAALGKLTATARNYALQLQQTISGFGLTYTIHCEPKNDRNIWQIYPELNPNNDPKPEAPTEPTAPTPTPAPAPASGIDWNTATIELTPTEATTTIPSIIEKLFDIDFADVSFDTVTDQAPVAKIKELYKQAALSLAFQKIKDDADYKELTTFSELDAFTSVSAIEAAYNTRITNLNAKFKQAATKVTGELANKQLQINGKLFTFKMDNASVHAKQLPNDATKYNPLKKK